MTKSTKILAVALVGAIITVTVMLAISFGGSASAATGKAEFDIVAQRIGGAFVMIPDFDVDPSIEAAALQAAKGDLSVRSGCAGETWPNITADCLTTADGSAAPRARYITVGYQAGESTTVLIRIPAPQVALY